MFWICYQRICIKCRDYTRAPQNLERVNELEGMMVEEVIPNYIYLVNFIRNSYLIKLLSSRATILCDNSQHVHPVF